jgi:uncharacterized membrane protein (DUF2068 family)
MSRQITASAAAPATRGDVVTARVVKSVAVVEAIKGIVVLLAGFGVLYMLNHDVRKLAVALVDFLHLDLQNGTGRKFIEAAERATMGELRGLTLLAFVYSGFRFVESYGLWRNRRWAEWLAVVSGLIYLPFEIYELGLGYTWYKLAALVINLAVVGLMGAVVSRKRRPS